MSTAKLHHTVPQFHLRRFTDADGRLWVWDKQDDRVFATTPNRIAAETHFYWLTQYEALGYDPLEMERQLSALEANTAAITAQWLEWLPCMAPLDRIPLPRANRAEVALFLAVQLLRTRDTRDILSALVELDRGVRPCADEERELHTDLIWDQDLVGLLARRFRRSIWIFGRNQTKTPFIISDNPTAFRTADNRQWLRAGILTAGTYLVYPLSPWFILYCYPPIRRFRPLRRFADTVSPVSFTPSMVESDNSGQAFMGTRFLISDRAQFEAERAFAYTMGTDTYAG